MRARTITCSRIAGCGTARSCLPRASHRVTTSLPCRWSSTHDTPPASWLHFSACFPMTHCRRAVIPSTPSPFVNGDLPNGVSLATRIGRIASWQECSPVCTRARPARPARRSPSRGVRVHSRPPTPSAIHRPQHYRARACRGADCLRPMSRRHQRPTGCRAVSVSLRRGSRCCGATAAARTSRSRADMPEVRTDTPIGWPSRCSPAPIDGSMIPAPGATSIPRCTGIGVRSPMPRRSWMARRRNRCRRNCSRSRIGAAPGGLPNA